MPCLNIFVRIFRREICRNFEFFLEDVIFILLNFDIYIVGFSNSFYYILRQNLKNVIRIYLYVYMDFRVVSILLIYILYVQGIKFDGIRSSDSRGIKWDFLDEFENIIEQSRGQSREDPEIWFRLLLRFIKSRSEELCHSSDDLRDARPVHPGCHVLWI